MQREEFLFKLSLCPNLGPVSRYQLWQTAQKLNVYQDIGILAEQLAWDQERVARLKKNWTSSELDDLVVRNQNVPHVLITDEAYPNLLKEIYSPPLVLYYMGDWSLTSLKSLAVVGARNMSDYGRRVMRRLLIPIVSKKLATISGLARGVDGMCHQLTMDRGGKTIGVIGTGIDVTYPKAHIILQHKMGIEQLVITEYPLGSRPLPHHFPERNRIIAGLAQACLVIQARQQSGSLITANLALQENRNVLAVPGPINDPLSQGTNELIAAGARPALISKDILEELQSQVILS